MKTNEYHETLEENQRLIERIEFVSKLRDRDVASGKIAFKALVEISKLPNEACEMALRALKEIEENENKEAS